MSGTHDEFNTGKRRSLSISFLEQFLRQGQQGRLAALILGKLDALNRIATTFGRDRCEEFCAEYSARLRNILPPHTRIIRLSERRFAVFPHGKHDGLLSVGLFLNVPQLQAAQQKLMAMPVYKRGGYDGNVTFSFTVDIINDTDSPELVHWHGLAVSAIADGAEEQGSPLVPAHGRQRVSFTPTHPGTRWYHTHAMAMDDMSKGAYSGQFGFLYVEPKREPGNYDQEIFLAARHWEPRILHRGDPNNDWTVDYASASLGTRALGHGEPIRVKRGQRVLFRLLNADATRDLNLALPGHHFTVVALDGNPVPNPTKVDVLQIVVAERVDAIVEMNNPGVWVMGSTRDADRAMGLGVVVEYENQTGEPQWKAPTGSAWDYTAFGAVEGASPRVAKPWKPRCFEGPVGCQRFLTSSGWSKKAKSSRFARSKRSAGNPWPLMTRKPMRSQVSATSRATRSLPCGSPARKGPRSMVGTATGGMRGVLDQEAWESPASTTRS